MVAIYSKNNGKIMITKQIEMFEINQKTKMVTIYYTKNDDRKTKIFDKDRQIFIKENGHIVFSQGA